VPSFKAKKKKIHFEDSATQVNGSEEQVWFTLSTLY
jgi:hypothetical protein